jgi:hypothetical protein
MNSNLLTNTLLMIIAVLLLVLVIQTGMNQPSFQPPRPMTNPHGDMGGEQPPPPAMENAPDAPAAPAGAMAGNIYFQSLKAFPAGCAGKAILADCDSPAAKVVKAQIEKLQASGLNIRQVFDKIVETWGEKALTEQALQIRRMRKK